MTSADCEQSSCELPVVVVGVPPPDRTSEVFSDEIISDLSVPQVNRKARNGTELRSTALENNRHVTPDPPMDSSEASASGQQTDTPETSGTEDIVRRSSVRVLRGILKKPRRYSREITTQENQETRLETRLQREQVNGESASIDQSIIPEISSQHSDDEQSQPNNPIESPTKPETNLATYKPQRGSLQMAAFDRILFAKRGAELRDEYMRDGRNNGDLV
jgi:hypothetical protein